MQHPLDVTDKLCYTIASPKRMVYCQNVRFSNCHIECADDCIVFKNTAAAMQYDPCENITVSNCTLTSTSAAIKFGSESEACSEIFLWIIV